MRSRPMPTPQVGSNPHRELSRRLRPQAPPLHHLTLFDLPSLGSAHNVLRFIGLGEEVDNLLLVIKGFRSLVKANIVAVFSSERRRNL